nr:monovalent cation/H+ antiporter subunit D family protein [Desulfobulbaceae bacterium]
MLKAQLPILILAVPLLTSFAIAIFSRKSNGLAYLLVVLATGVSFVCSLGVLQQVLETGEVIHYFLGNWQPPYGIELVIDHLNAMVLAVVSGAAFLTAIYSKHTVLAEVPDRFSGEKIPERVPNYYTLYALLVTGLLGIVATGDAFNLYVLLEISALSSYALLTLGRGRAYYATFKYLIMGTIGACLYLLGVGYLYIKTGSLNMADLKGILSSPVLMESPTIKIGFMLIIVGIWVKMAFFPLHGWLPNAYTYASNTTSCLVAPLMTKVSVYMMIRLMFSVFSAQYIFEVLGWQDAVVWLAAAAILFGSISALGQDNMKRMLTYIVVAEVGYMVGGTWLANANGLTGATYHILSDAMMTLCLFMAVGAVIYKTGNPSRNSMRGIFRKMPITSVVFLIGAFAMIGIPPTCGFFSKWYLVSGAIEANHWGFAAALLISSLINAVIFFRIIEIGYFPKFDDQENSSAHHEHTDVAISEVPLSMLFPMVLTALSLIAIGVYSNEIITGLVSRTIPAGLL